jgi:hypothetical protein
MRGVIALAAAVAVIACSDSYGEGPPSADGGTNGEGDGVAIEVTPSELDFRDITCGQTSPAQIVVLRNRSATSAKYKLQVPEGAAFEVQGALEGDLGADSVTAVNVVAKPKVAGSNDSSIVVTAGATLAQVTVRARGDGGKLEIAPNGVDLGGVRRQNGGATDVTFVNTGTKAITVTEIASSTADFSATWPGKPAPLTLEPNVPQKVTVSLAAGNESGVLTADLTTQAGGPICGSVPALPVRGQRVNLDVTISPADFGDVTCKSSPTQTRDVVISNYSTSVLTYTASLDKGTSSAFTIVSATAGTVNAGSSATPATASVTVGMKPVGATVGALAETVSIDIMGVPAPAGGKRPANATATVRGAVLAIAPSDLTGFARGQVKNFTLSNTGNADVNVITTTFVRDTGTTQKPAWYTSFPSSVTGAAQRTGTIQFMPGTTDHGTYAGTYTVGSPSTICNGPVTLHVQGTY